MRKNLPLTVAGILFALIALMHLLRLFYHFELIVGGQPIPLWVNGVAFIITLFLAIWMFISTY